MSTVRSSEPESYPDLPGLPAGSAPSAPPPGAGVLEVVCTALPMRPSGGCGRPGWAQHGPVVAPILSPAPRGVPDRPRGTIEQPIDRHPHARDKMAVRQGGREVSRRMTVVR